MISDYNLILLVIMDECKTCFVYFWSVSIVPYSSLVEETKKQKNGLEMKAWQEGKKDLDKSKAWVWSLRKGCWRMKKINDEKGRVVVRRVSGGHEGKRPEVIAQALSEPWCVTAQEMKCPGRDPDPVIYKSSGEQYIVSTAIKIPAHCVEFE